MYIKKTMKDCKEIPIEKLDILRKCHNNNGTIFITIPKDLVEELNIKPNDLIKIVIHQHIKDNKVIDLYKLNYN